MVDVRDDGDVAKLHREGSLSLSALARALQEAGQKGQRNLAQAEIARVD
jgi:lambda repressor-like predicted transcriptional regulator